MKYSLSKFIKIYKKIFFLFSIIFAVFLIPSFMEGLKPHFREFNPTHLQSTYYAIISFGSFIILPFALAINLFSRKKNNFISFVLLNNFLVFILWAIFIFKGSSILLNLWTSLLIIILLVTDFVFIIDFILKPQDEREIKH